LTVQAFKRLFFTLLRAAALFAERRFFCCSWLPSSSWLFYEHKILNLSVQIPSPLREKGTCRAINPSQSRLFADILASERETLIKINEVLFKGCFRIWQQTINVIRNYFSDRRPE